MTERKPPGMPVHNWVDKLIQDAAARGEFDNLPGAGKPLPGLDRPWDEDWWIKQKIRDEELPVEGMLPPVLQLRREVAALPERVRDLSDEAAVRAMVSDVNERVAAWIRRPSGPVLPVGRADVEAIVQGWREARDAAAAAQAPEPEAVPETSDRPRRRSWRRRR